MKDLQSRSASRLVIIPQRLDEMGIAPARLKISSWTGVHCTQCRRRSYILLDPCGVCGERKESAHMVVRAWKRERPFERSGTEELPAAHQLYPAPVAHTVCL
ncbi:hypothetical protein AAFF_G00223510 [Aldrovandia affinis]|uniref:Uncharacterized protein n=1 Tax=Aldrovandia affinis TaxID=143900 RepID=A0AAD7X291_9TELE|nr:hypothetical protein AAFF_G00223510 [Aldrovandia affinis]